MKWEDRGGMVGTGRFGVGETLPSLEKVKTMRVG